MALDDSGNVYVGFTTESGDLPVTKDALYQSIDVGMELVILILDKTLKNIEYSTYGGVQRR